MEKSHPWMEKSHPWMEKNHPWMESLFVKKKISSFIFIHGWKVRMMMKDDGHGHSLCCKTLRINLCSDRSYFSLLIKLGIVDSRAKIFNATLEQVPRNYILNISHSWQIFHPQCANQESNKVERYSKTNCTGWTGMPQGFQFFFCLKS